MYGSRVVVDVVVDRRAVGVAAADVTLTELGLKAVSAPLTVVPYAELDRARWGQDEAREGDAVVLSCQVTGTGAGVKRLEGQTADVEILRGDEGEGAEGIEGVLFEPVTMLRVPVTDGQIEATWRVGFDAEGKARIATQAELDETAERTGSAAGQYRQPVHRFRVRLAGLEAESGPLRYADRIEIQFVGAGGGVAEGLSVVAERPDGERSEAPLGPDGTVALDAAPAGRYRVVTSPPSSYTDPSDASLESA